jgi:glutathione-regulated potassium-efflux system ancillary protein KefG
MNLINTRHIIKLSSFRQQQVLILHKTTGTAEMSNKVLILFAHPRLERSANNSAIIKKIPAIPEVTFHDLYELYPDFNIDVGYEKRLLLENQIIIWHHPFYWYSSPPLLKQWIDLVLEFGWAYGPGGNSLQGKIAFNSITTGGRRSAYSNTGHNRFSINQLLAPFDQTAVLCKMIYLPPFVIHGTHRITKEDINHMAGQYGLLIEKLVNNEFSAEEIMKFSYLNDWLDNITDKKSVL